MSTDNSESTRAVGERLKDEMREYIFISAYLWVCFSIILAYSNSLAATNEASLVPLTSALIKALIIGKFILIGKALKPGERRKPNALLGRILWKSVSMLVVLVVFTFIEEIVVGMVHGSTPAAVISELTGRPLLQLIAPPMLMLLVLIPMIGFEEVDRELGEGTLRHMLFGGSSST